MFRDTPPVPRDPPPDGGLCQTRQRTLYRYRNAGGAWDSAKKYVEKANLGGKGSETHTACVVGDPFKDTSSRPSMNNLINLLAIISLVIAPLLTS